MEIARLGIVLQVDEARRQARSLASEFRVVAEAADRSSTEVARAMKRAGVAAAEVSQELKKIQSSRVAVQVEVTVTGSQAAKAVRAEVEKLGAAAAKASAEVAAAMAKASAAVAQTRRPAGISLQVDANSKQVAALRQELDQVGKTATRSSAEASAALRKVGDAASQASKDARKLQDSLRIKVEPVRVTVSTDQALRKARELREALKLTTDPIRLAVATDQAVRQIRALQEALRLRAETVRISVATEQATRQVRALQDALRLKADPVRITVATEQARRQLRQLQEELLRVRSDVRVTLSTGEARREASALTAEILRIGRAAATVEDSLRALRRAAAATAAVQTPRLARIADQRVTVTVRVDEARRQVALLQAAIRSVEPEAARTGSSASDSLRRVGTAASATAREVQRLRDSLKGAQQTVSVQADPRSARALQTELDAIGRAAARGAADARAALDKLNSQLAQSAREAVKLRDALRLSSQRTTLSVSTEAARRQAKTLQTEVENVGKSSAKASAQLASASASMAAQLQQITAVLRTLQSQAAATGQTVGQLGSKVSATASALAGGPNSFAGAAATANTAANAVTRSLQRMVAQFLTLEAARRFVKAMIDATIDFERIRGVLSLVTSSAKEAAEQFNFLQRESDRIGIVFRDTADRFAKFEAAARDSGISVKELKETFVTVAEAGRRFGLSSSDQSRIFLALEQMVSKGVVSMEELRRQLGDALPGAFSIAARSMGMTGREFAKLVESGKLATADFLGPFTRELAKMAPAGDTVASTAAEINRLKNAWDRFLASQGIQAPVKFASKVAAGALNELSETDEQRARRERARAAERQRAIEQLEREGMLRRSGSGFMEDFMFRRGQLGLGPRIASENDLVEQRMRLNKLRDERALEIAKQGRTTTGSVLFDVGQSMFENLQKQAAPPNVDQIEKFQKEANRLAMEGLEGRERIVESWRQEEQRVKSLGLTLLQTEELRKQLDAARDAELKKFDEEAQRAAETSRAEELTAAYKQLQTILRDARIEGLDPVEAAQERVNEKFRKELELLYEIGEAGFDTAEAYDAITKARDKALREIKTPRNRGGFTGESVAELRAGIRDDERGLLTESDAQRFQEVTQRIQDRSAELARRLKADAATVKEAWSVGWEDQVKTFGSFQERVAQAGAGLADTLDRNFTDAFTAMVTGTKSVGDAFRDMTASIMSDLARIAIQKFVVQQVLGGITSFGSAAFGGGTAPAGTGTAAVTGASAGGVAGSGFSEFNQGVDRIVAAQGGQRRPQVNITLVNSFDMKDVDDHLAANPDAVVNSLSRRAGTVKRMVERS